MEGVRGSLKGDNMCLFWSLRGSKYQGRAYWKTHSASIFLNVIYYDADGDYATFLTHLLWTTLHEYLHLFLKFEEGRWYNSCKTIIDPLAEMMMDEMIKNREFVDQMVNDYEDVRLSLSTMSTGST